MCRRSTSSATRRAVIAVAALYALLLQAFLGALAPMPTGLDGLAALCGEHADGRAPVDTATCRAHACCLPAQAPQLAVPPPVAAAPVRPRRVAETVVRPPERAALPRAPPEIRPQPRGPPASS
jgi:hypothetical protein